MYGRQRGGMRFLFTKYKTLKELRTAMADLNSKGVLPIPSQQSATCGMDAITASLWYSDILGEYLWHKYVFANGGVVDTHDVEKGPRSHDQACSGVLSVMAYRVAQIMQSVSVTLKQDPALVPSDPLPPQVLSRPRSARGPTAVPTGEVSSNLVHIIAKKEKDVDPQRDTSDHTIALSTAVDAMNAAVSQDDNLKENVRLVHGEKIQEVFKTGGLSGMKCVAVAIGMRNLDNPQSGHAIAVVLSNGIWTLMDNDVGVAIALPEFTFRDFSGTFSITSTQEPDRKRKIGVFMTVEYKLTRTDGTAITKVINKEMKYAYVSDTITTRLKQDADSVNQEVIFANPRLLVAIPADVPPVSLETQIANVERDLSIARENLAQQDGAAAVARVDDLERQLKSLREVQAGRGRRTHRKRILRSRKFGYRSRRNHRGRSSRVISV